MVKDIKMNLALRYLARKPKTVMEMTQYLKGKGLEPGEIDRVIHRLKELNYLNDHTFAKQFIDGRIRFKPKSAYALGYELKRKGIDPDITEVLLLPLDDTELAWAAAKKKGRIWQHLDPDTRQKKLLNHLRYRGFDHGVCMRILERFLTEF